MSAFNHFETYTRALEDKPTYDYCEDLARDLCRKCGAMVCPRHSTEDTECYDRSDTRPLHLPREFLEKQVADERIFPDELEKVQ